ncbi:MAG: two-component system, LytTR family, sensor kinase [Thermoanaerobaculia bacterium]|nr:two-component system, LytTR family, sensor kinase [Thermoanaerobaculia bacterium]
MDTPQRPPYARLSSRELLLIFAFWTFIATLSAVNRALDPRGFGFQLSSPVGPIALEYIESWIWALITPIVFLLTQRFPIERRHLPRLGILLLIGIVIAIAVDLAMDFARIEVFAGLPSRRPRVFSPKDAILRFRFLNQLLVYLAVLAAGYARNFYLRDLTRQREAVALEARAAELQAQLAAARLDALRMQLNPHFLFNTLHAVSALVERDPAGVRRMIARLSELLRHTIEARGADEVPLRDELEFLRRYIEIMEIRFQGRLTVSVNADDRAMEALVPNLILQPIVENALEHGASRASGQGEVTIDAKVDGDDLVVTVQDNGPGLFSNAEGVGLRNTKARLDQLYGDPASLTLASPPAGGVLATLRIPYHTAADLRTRAIHA